MLAGTPEATTTDGLLLGATLGPELFSTENEDEVNEGLEARAPSSEAIPDLPPNERESEGVDGGAGFNDAETSPLRPDFREPIRLAIEDNRRFVAGSDDF